jgi:hypothetical protein
MSLTPQAKRIHDSGWFKLLLRVMRHDSKESTEIRCAHALLRTCVSRGGHSTLLRYFDVRPAFPLTHQLIVLHTWIVSKRLLHDQDKALQRELFTALWENTERRIRAEGVNEMSVNKHLAEVQRLSYGALTAYDAGFAQTSDGDQELGSSLYRNVFAANKAVSDAVVLDTAAWLRGEVGRVRTMDREFFRQGQLFWTLPRGAVVTSEDLLAEEARGAAGEWRRALAVDGRHYWWNIDSRESRWERPVAAPTTTADCQATDPAR